MLWTSTPLSPTSTPLSLLQLHAEEAIRPQVLDNKQRPRLGLSQFPGQAIQGFPRGPTDRLPLTRYGTVNRAITDLGFGKDGDRSHGWLLSRPLYRPGRIEDIASPDPKA
jgi:hypothetical protein